MPGGSTGIRGTEPPSHRALRPPTAYHLFRFGEIYLCDKTMGNPYLEGCAETWEVSTYSNEKLRWTVSNRRFPHFQCQPQRERLSVFASRGGVESPRVRRSGRGGSTSRPRSGVRRPRAAPGARLARFAALTAGKRRRTPRTEREAGVQRARYRVLNRVGV